MIYNLMTNTELNEEIRKRRNSTIVLRYADNTEFALELIKDIKDATLQRIETCGGCLLWMVELLYKDFVGRGHDAENPARAIVIAWLEYDDIQKWAL